MQVIKMAKKMPILIYRFTNLFWVNLPNYWTIKFLYTQDILFVSMLIPENNSTKKIQRQYKKEMIEKRKEDLWGLSSDCTDEIKNSILKAN